MSLDARSAVSLIRLFRVVRNASGGLSWEGEMAEAAERSGIDFYREICCAMGTEASFEGYPAAVRRAGSALGDRLLRRIFERVSRIPFRLSLVPDCGFLHFGTPRQLITSGNALLGGEFGASEQGALLAMNNEILRPRPRPGPEFLGRRMPRPVGPRPRRRERGHRGRYPVFSLLPPKAVLDILEGRDRRGRKVHFVRCYAVDDVLNKPEGEGGLLAGLSLGVWLEALGASEDDVWDPGTRPGDKDVWNGRFFPALRGPEGFRDWLWMLRPKNANLEQKKAWKGADRYSFAETAGLASHEVFHSRRHRNMALAMAGRGAASFSRRADFRRPSFPSDLRTWPERRGGLGCPESWTPRSAASGARGPSLDWIASSWRVSSILSAPLSQKACPEGTGVGRGPSPGSSTRCPLPGEPGSLPWASAGASSGARPPGRKPPGTRRSRSSAGPSSGAGRSFWSIRGAPCGATRSSGAGRRSDSTSAAAGRTRPRTLSRGEAVSSTPP